MRATLLFDENFPLLENFTLLKIFILKGFSLQKKFQIIHKAALHSGNVFGMHLYMFSTDIKLEQEIYLNEKALLAAVSSRPTKIAHEFSSLKIDFPIFFPLISWIKIFSNFIDSCSQTYFF